jgi:hypothetical protein
MTCTRSMQAISAKTNMRAANVKREPRGHSQNRLHVQKALMEYLLLGKVGN